MMALMLILASQSPRRREILAAAGLPFTVRAARIPEVPLPGETPSAHVRRLALEKARIARQSADEVVLGADTVVVIDGEILGKPRDRAEASEMLRKLSGRNHVVLTGIALLHPGGEIIDEAATTVHFALLAAEEIDTYAASGEPDDKAGAYAIQGLASKFIDSIEGDYFNVVGLPVALVYRHLRTLGRKPGTDTSQFTRP
jgi:septum formation protein